MHTHGIQVLDGADNHETVIGIAHHLELVLFPADDRLLDEHLVDRALVQTVHHHVIKVVQVVGDAAPTAAQGEGGSDDGRQTDLVQHSAGLSQRRHGETAGHLQPDLYHRALEQVAILCKIDGLRRGADQRHTIPG